MVCMIAGGVKQYHLDTVIGQPIDEAANDFGEVYRFNLPDSKRQMTTTFDMGADCDPKGIVR